MYLYPIKLMSSLLSTYDQDAYDDLRILACGQRMTNIMDIQAAYMAGVLVVYMQTGCPAC